MGSGSVDQIHKKVDLVEYIGRYVPLKREGDEWKGKCPFHDDREPSLSVNQEKGLWNCFGCGAGGDVISFCMKQHNLKFNAAARRLCSEYGIETPETDGKGQSNPGVTLEQLAGAKGFSVEGLASFGFEDTMRSGKPAVRIVYADEKGEPKAIRYRLSLNGEKRFAWEKGAQTSPFGLQYLDRAREAGFLILVEGETDTVTCLINDVPALGIPGAAMHRCLLQEYVLGIPKIYVVEEPDSGGRRFALNVHKRLGELAWEGALEAVQLEWEGQRVKDANDLYLMAGDEFGSAITEALSTASELAETRATVRSVSIWDYKQLRKTKWLWEPWFPEGYLSLIVGETGVGKSYLAAYLIACCLGVKQWPTGGTASPSGVLLVETEAFREAYLDRLASLGVGVDSDIRLPVGPESDDPLGYVPSLPKDMDLLERMLAEDRYSAVFVDSLSASHLIDENSAEMKKVLIPLGTLARETGVPVIAVAHLRKRGRNETGHELALDRIRGSSTVAYLARSIVGLERRSAEGPVVVRSLKANLAKRPDPFAFYIDDEGGFHLREVPTYKKPQTTTDECRDWLVSVLVQQGRVKPFAVRQMAEAAGYTRSTLYRARDDLGIITIKGEWVLPWRNLRGPSLN